MISGSFVPPPPPSNQNNSNNNNPQIPMKNQRSPWTENEIIYLLKGVIKYGIGSWAKILKDPDYRFNEQRGNVEAKDKFRTLKTAFQRGALSLLLGRHPSLRLAFEGPKAAENQIIAIKMITRNSKESRDGSNLYFLVEYSNNSVGWTFAPTDLPTWPNLVNDYLRLNYRRLGLTRETLAKIPNYRELPGEKNIFKSVQENADFYGKVVMNPEMEKDIVAAVVNVIHRDNVERGHELQKISAALPRVPRSKSKKTILKESDLAQKTISPEDPDSEEDEKLHFEIAGPSRKTFESERIRELERQIEDLKSLVSAKISDEKPKPSPKPRYPEYPPTFEEEKPLFTNNGNNGINGKRGFVESSYAQQDEFDLGYGGYNGFGSSPLRKSSNYAPPPRQAREYPLTVEQPSRKRPFHQPSFRSSNRSPMFSPPSSNNRNDQYYQEFEYGNPNRHYASNNHVDNNVTPSRPVPATNRFSSPLDRRSPVLPTSATKKKPLNPQQCHQQ